MLCEHKQQQAYSICCQQIVCTNCICCSDPKTIPLPETQNSLCQRCDQKEVEYDCEQCKFSFCLECSRLLHNAGKFLKHTQNPIKKEQHGEITKQLAILNEFEKYSTEQIDEIKKYFDQIQDVLDKKKKQLLDTVNNYRTQQVNLLTKRLHLIEAAVKINSEQTLEIPKCVNYEIETFNLTAKEKIIENICSIEITKPLDMSTVSPRRVHTQSVRRSASCRKFEQNENKLSELCEIFERRKFIKQICQSNSIQLTWSHCLIKVEYILELGIGMKIKGIEQFKQIYRGNEPNYIVSGLQNKTNYKFRVQAFHEGKSSEFSEVLTLTTLPQQSIEDNFIVQKKQLNNNEIQVQFEKPGIVIGTNPLYFGVWSWEIKLLINGIVEDLTASLVVGVSNKQKRMIGTTLNYGYQRESLVIKVVVDMDNKCLTITSKMNPNGERFTNLVGPVYPAFQNKNTHKASGYLRKLNNYVDKEVLNLTGGLYPFALFSQNKPQNHQKWVQEEIQLKHGKIKKIKAWVPELEKGKLFSGEKFNIDPECIEFNETEITVDDDWTFQETKYLFEQLRRFNYNFIILNDRYEYENKNRDIYQLKDRYFAVMREVLHKRNQTSHPFYNYVYDEEFDRYRNMELDKYLKRTKQVCDEEKKLQEDLRKIDQQIKKQEKEHKSLTKCINVQENDEIDEKQMKYIIEMGEKNEEIKKKTSERIVYLRNKWINEVLPIPNSIKEKLDRQLKDLISTSKLVLNQEIEEQFCQLRKLQLGVLSQQRLQKRRDQDKKNLEDKIKKLKAQLEQQQKK